MGLIKALKSSVSSTLGDQFKEYVTCPTIDKDVLIQRGEIHHGDGNTNPSDNIISNGSAIVVPEGMAMMVIDNGAIIDFSAEPGTYTFDKSSEPSIFAGSLGESIKATIKTIGNRFTYGGQTAKDQRVYYVNLLVIAGNKFGSPQPKKITDEKYGMLEVTFFGEYAYQVKDPVTLVHNVIGANAKDTVTCEEVIGSQLKAKFVEQLTKAISIVMRKNKVSFGDMGLYGGDISDEMNTILNDSWRKGYGLEITDVAIADINLTDESMKRVSKIDDAAIFSNSAMQSGLMASATADAMKSAAENSSGAAVGFMGMNMAQNAGASAMNAANQNNTNNQGAYNPETNQPENGTMFQHEEKAEEKQEDTGDKKFCTECGKEVSSTAKFCPHCGTKQE